MIEQEVAPRKTYNKDVDFSLRQIMYNHSFYGPDDLVPRDCILIYVGAKQNVIRTKDFLLAMHWYRANNLCDGGLTGNAFLLAAFSSYKVLFDQNTIRDRFLELKKLSIKNIDFKFHFCDPKNVVDEEQILLMAPYMSTIRNCSFPERLKNLIYKQRNEL